jgi:hypothetical protein
LSLWERWIAHTGYVAEGLLYLLLGTFALLATMDGARRAAGTQGVLVRLSLSPPGELLLAAVALGLASFVTWQLLIAIRDPEHRRDPNQRFRSLVRIGHLFSGALNSLIVVEALRVLFGVADSTNGEHAQKEWIERAFTMPLGRYAVGTVGIGISVYGLYQGYRAASRRRDSTVDLSHTRLRPYLDALGICGLLARGVMFELIGVYLTRAAWSRHAQYAVGVAGALNSLKHQPYGEWLLGSVAAGLIAYGLWLIAKEPYRQLRNS